jgi:hypothetical protein
MTMLVFWFSIPPLSLVLKKEAVCFTETLISTHKSTRRYNSEDQHQHLYRRENLKSHTITLTLFTRKCTHDVQFRT